MNRLAVDGLSAPAEFRARAAHSPCLGRRDLCETFADLGVAVKPALPDIPFRYIIPADADAADYHRINVETWRRLQSGEPLWDLDFAPPLPPPPQSAAISGGAVLSALAFAAVLAVAFSSKS